MKEIANLIILIDFYETESFQFYINIPSTIVYNIFYVCILKFCVQVCSGYRNFANNHKKAERGNSNFLLSRL